MNNLNYLGHSESESIYNDPLCGAIINSSIFQRLFKIPFMGGLSYINNSHDGSTSRGEHSVAVAFLAFYLAKRQELSPKTKRLYVVSALLHDISHLPFSHTMDFAMKEQKSFSHTTESFRIISQKDQDEESIENILSKFKIRKDELIMFRPKPKRPLIFRSSHNIDTLDGIHRAYCFFKKTEDKKSAQDYMLSLLKSIEKLTFNTDDYDDERYNHHLKLWDKFWEVKNDVYTNNIYEQKKILFERILSYYLFDLCENKKITNRLLKYSDSDLFSFFPDLHSKIEQLWNCISREPTSETEHINCDTKKRVNLLFRTRRFQINKRAMVNFKKLSSLRQRYRIYPNDSVIALNKGFKSEVTDILSYPLFRKRLENIALGADNYLL